MPHLILTLIFDLLLFEFKSFYLVFNVLALLFLSCLLILARLVKHNCFKLHVAVLVLQSIPLLFKLLIHSLIFFHHFLFDGLIFLVKFKCLFFVNRDVL